MNSWRHRTLLASLILGLAIVMAIATACGSGSSPATQTTPSRSSQPSTGASTPASNVPSAAPNSPVASPATAPAASPASGAPYKVGVTSALTGPAAASYLPIAEGVRIYFEDLNAKGGIDGHPVQVEFQDDHADAGTAATNMQKFTTEGVNLLVDNSTSATYAPAIAAAKRANVPILVIGVSPPQALPPKPDPLVFASAQVAAANVDGPRELQSVSKLMKGAPFKIAFVTVDVPGAVANTKRAIGMEKQFNAQVSMIKVPLNLVDFSSIASQIISAGDDWATDVGPGIGTSVYTTLEKLGYKGSYIEPTPTDMADLAKFKKESLYYSSPMGPWDPSRPDHQRIQAAAKTYGATVTSSHLIIGWAQGETVAAVLRQTGWPASTDKMLKVMDNFQLSFGQTYPPIQWTPTDHEGAVYWRIYHWDASKQAILPALDWYSVDAQGDVNSITDVGNQLP